MLHFYVRVPNRWVISLLVTASPWLQINIKCVLVLSQWNQANIHGILQWDNKLFFGKYFLYYILEMFHQKLLENHQKHWVVFKTSELVDKSSRTVSIK